MSRWHHGPHLCCAAALLLLLLLLLHGGCFELDVPSGTLRCDPGRAEPCPAGMVCAGGRCYDRGALPDARAADATADASAGEGPRPDLPVGDRPSTDLRPTDWTPADWTPTPDADPGVVILEAESYDAKSSVDGTHNWVLKSDVSGYLGSGFMQVPVAPKYVNCNASVGSCGARMDYGFTLPSSGTWYFHFRVRAEDGSEDSINWGTGGALHDQVSWTTYGAWLYLTDSKSLNAGAHTLTIWMRETDARVDRIVVSDSAKPPS